jgi:hypothetical protein
VAMSEAVLVRRAKRVLAQVGESLIKRQGAYFIRNRRDQLFRIALLRFAREMSLQ